MSWCETGHHLFVLLAQHVNDQGQHQLLQLL